MPRQKVPVSVITGYLGSGKTTLLKRILETSGKKIAVVMNEFGSVGIDTKIVRGKNVDIIELLGGCVCCSLTGELEAAIFEILEKVKPEMIVIETTGVAEPDSMTINLGTIEEIYLDSVITVVDADAFLNYPEMGHTGRVQIESADVMVLNKVDLVKIEDIEKIASALSKMNPRAKIIRATYCNVDIAGLFGLVSDRPFLRHGEHNVLVFDSFVYRSERVHDSVRFAAFLSSLPKDIYRAKGFVLLGSGQKLLNFVNGRYELTESDKDTGTEVVFIGVGIRSLEGQVLSAFKECEM